MEKQEPDAALALARWEKLRQATDGERAERRFRRRAYQRARDRALQALAMRLTPWMLTRQRAIGSGQRAIGSADGARIRRPNRRRRGTPRALP
jgi:hypothetical protein